MDNTTTSTTTPAPLAPLAPTPVVGTPALFTQGGAVAGLQPTIYAPITSTSPYTFTQVQGGTVTIDQGMASLLGVAAGPQPIAYLMSIYNQMSRGQRILLQSELSKAGFYEGAGGAPGVPGQIGTVDDAGSMAFINALLMSAQSGQSLDTTVATRIAGGAGAQTAQGGPLTGGANAYTIDLTPAAAIANTAHTAAQALLGRDPTAAELAKITAVLHQAETTYQTGKNQLIENTQQQQFQAKVAAQQAQNTPAVPLGSIPNGPFKNTGQWAVAFLQYLNPQQPVTASQVATIIGWANSIGIGMSGNNPLGITLEKPGSSQTGGGTMPTAQKYKTAADGMQAAAQTLAANYPNLLAALMSPDPQSVLTSPNLQAELTQFSGAKVAKSIVANTNAKATQTQAQAAAAAYVPPATGPQGSAVTPALQAPPATDAGVQTARTTTATGSAADFRQAEEATAVPVGSAADFRQAEEASQTPLAAGQQIPSSQLATQEGNLPAGTAYVPPTTLTSTTAPSASDVEYQQFTTGANKVPYEAYDYLQAFNAIMSMVHANTPVGM